MTEGAARVIQSQIRRKSAMDMRDKCRDSAARIQRGWRRRVATAAPRAELAARKARRASNLAYARIAQKFVRGMLGRVRARKKRAVAKAARRIVAYARAQLCLRSDAVIGTRKRRVRPVIVRLRSAERR